MSDNPLLADKPLKDPKLDLLNYAPFASTLADSICNITLSDGLVIGIYGPWGSGKSTLIEFILEFIEQKPKSDKPTIIRFNPWWFSGQENLVRHFLNQLYAAFGSAGGKGVRKLVSGIQHLSDIYAEIPVVGSSVPKTIAGKITAFEQRDITKVKSDISNILKQREKPTLIVIDDIDRLSGEEIRQLFSLIKSVADFPNVIYLLAFDKSVVVGALGPGGDRFLEKIVQVPFEIPVISKYELQDLLLKGLQKIVGGNIANMLNQHRFSLNQKTLI